MEINTFFTELQSLGRKNELRERVLMYGIRKIIDYKKKENQTLKKRIKNVVTRYTVDTQPKAWK